MSPSELAVRITAADGRFEHARQCDDIPEMRAALSEKTELLKSYYAALQNRVARTTENAKSAAVHE